MKNTIKLVLAIFILSSVFITSCKKVDFKDIIEKVRDDKGDKDGDKDRGDKDGDKDRGDKDGDKDRGDKDGDKDKGDGKGNGRDSTGRR